MLGIKLLHTEMPLTDIYYLMTEVTLKPYLNLVSLIHVELFHSPFLPHRAAPEWK